ncbi:MULTISPECIES: lipase chaperone [unclassified Butyrivibrio]|uniref:lipase chaperone n=1 Tax=unclassified Butyrivibrio TaxID=2639466 RepID=UPI00040A7F8B|nr:MULTISPECIES: lipase chaperone [unclassified Butyrivibrio]SDB19766.1 hypothetical protein SAMN02910263_00956 [Butyrivibrio sp. INlla16]
MKIRRKEIIKEIICEEASKREFQVEWGTKSGRIWDVATFRRNGVGQKFVLVEIVDKPGMIRLDGFYPKNLLFKYESEEVESYRAAISEVEVFLENEGYRALDEVRRQHAIEKEDRDYVFENMKELSSQFCDDNGINDVDINQALGYIAEAFLGMRGKEWEDIKQDFYKVVAFYMHNLLKVPSLEVYRKQIAEGMDEEIQKVKGKSLDIRRIDNKYINTAPLNGALGKYYSDRSVKEIISDYVYELNRLLTIEELQKNNIKVEQWKRDEALNDMANHF